MFNLHTSMLQKLAGLLHRKLARRGKQYCLYSNGSIPSLQAISINCASAQRKRLENRKFSLGTASETWNYWILRFREIVCVPTAVCVRHWAVCVASPCVCDNAPCVRTNGRWDEWTTKYRRISLNCMVFAKFSKIYSPTTRPCAGSNFFCVLATDVSFGMPQTI